MIGTEGNVLATERFKGDDTQYYLYNEDIQGSTTSLVKEDGSADAIYQYTDFGETIIHGDDQAKMKCAILAESMIRVRDCII